MRYIGVSGVQTCPLPISGFIEPPSRRVENGRVTGSIGYLTADEEDRFVVAQANSPLDAQGRFAEDRVLVRTKGGEVDYLAPESVDYMDVSPRQMTSDRKSTRLNSSHANISYAVFCLKKKKRLQLA